MQPKRLAFTDDESRQLGEFLDQFVAAGPMGNLSEDDFKAVQVLVARKIWELRPDIARAMQAVADKDSVPALLIGNVPVDEQLPDTPRLIKMYGGTPRAPLRSDFFHAGVSLIRYGDIVPYSAMDMIDVVNEDTLEGAWTAARPPHRDIYRYNLRGDIGLHVQRENPAAATPLMSIDEVPPELFERLKNVHFKDGGAPFVEEHEGAYRFNPTVSGDNAQYQVDNGKAVEDLFSWMTQKAKEEPLVLHKNDFLLIDQSRVFHAASAHQTLTPKSQDRWVTHMRGEVLKGKQLYLRHEKEPFYLSPEHICTTSLLANMATGQHSAPSTVTR